MINKKLPMTRGSIFLRILLLGLVVAAALYGFQFVKTRFLYQGEIAGDQVPKKTFRATEYLTSKVVDPKAFKKLKLDYVYRGNIRSAEEVNKMFDEFRDYEVFGTKTMVHKRYIPHLNTVSESGDGILQAIHLWAVANEGKGGSASDPAPEYVVCFNEQNLGYAVGWTNEYTDKMLKSCIYTIRHPFGPNDPRNDKWANVKIIMSLGSQVDTLTKAAEDSPWNEPWDPIYSGFDYHIANSPVTYEGTVVTTPIDTRLTETAKLVDGRSDPITGTYWESPSTTLPVSIQIKLNVDTRPLPSLVNRVRFYPKLVGATTGKVTVEVWGTNAANESEEKLLSTISETVTNGQLIERVFNPPASFAGTTPNICAENICPISRIKLVVREWPGKVGFYEISADRKAFPENHPLSWAVIGLFPKWPTYVMDALKKYNSQIYGYALHYYPGYICRGWDPQGVAQQNEYGYRMNDQSYIDCTRDYIQDAKRFLSTNGFGNKPLLITEWGDAGWMNPAALPENKKLSWRDPVRWFQYWDMLKSEGIEMMTFYSPIWIRDFNQFDPAVQCRPENQTWECHADKLSLGCRVAPAGLVAACDPNHPLTASETLNPYGEAFAKLADIESGVLPPPPTIKNGGFEENLTNWQFCGDSKTLGKKSDTKATYSFVRDAVRQNPIAGSKSLIISASEAENVKGTLTTGVCQDTIWPKVDLLVRYLTQSKDNNRNGIIISATDSQGQVRIGLNVNGALSKSAYDLYTVYPLRVKANLTKKAKLSFDFGRFYFEKYNRGIDPTFKLAIEVVADGAAVSLQVDDVQPKSYVNNIGRPSNSSAFNIVDEN